MKKIGLAIIVALATLQAKAQVTDLKILAHKTPNEIIALYGNPVKNDNGVLYVAQKTLVYPDYQFFYNEDANGAYQLSGFIISSNRICIFSDYIEGGIKIGDSLERLQSIDFVHTPYGRGKQGNALHQSEQNWYYAYEQENAYFGFKIEGNHITEFYYTELEDCNPNNNNPYSPFGN